MIIFTKHALERLKERGISKNTAVATFNHPDSSRHSKTKGYVYYKRYGNQKIEVVAKKTIKGDWLILSVWSRPIHHKYTQDFLTKLINKCFDIFNKA